MTRAGMSKTAHLNPDLVNELVNVELPVVPAVAAPAVTATLTPQYIALLEHVPRLPPPRTPLTK